MKSNKELLECLDRLTDKLFGKCFFVFFGGFAIDGHCGHFTREHGDVDGICRRKNVDTVREALGSLGFDSKLYIHPEDADLVYKLCTTDVDKTFTFQIVDFVSDDTFEISFYRFLRECYSVDFLEPERGVIESVKFPIVSKDFLIALKRREDEFYKQQKINNPEKYEKNIRRHKNALHDIELLLRLIESG